MNRAGLPVLSAFLYRDRDDFIIADIPAIEKETRDSTIETSCALLPLLPLGSYREEYRGRLMRSLNARFEARYRVDGIEISRARRFRNFSMQLNGDFTYRTYATNYKSRNTFN